MRNCILASVALLSVLVSVVGCAGSSERVASISPFPVVRPSGGFGPDVLSTEGHYLVGYEHTFFCESKVTVRREDDPSCTGDVQDCARSFERVVATEVGRCAQEGERFTLGGVRMLSAGQVGGNNGNSEDVLSGSCAAGFVLGRSTAHPIRLVFAEPSACASLEASFRTKSPTLELDLAVKTADEVTFVASRVVP